MSTSEPKAKLPQIDEAVWNEDLQAPPACGHSAAAAPALARSLPGCGWRIGQALRSSRPGAKLRPPAHSLPTGALRARCAEFMPVQAMRTPGCGSLQQRTEPFQPVPPAAVCLGTAVREQDTSAPLTALSENSL